jgi:hypothetical protein
MNIKNGGLLAQTTSALLVATLGSLLAGLGCLWADRQAGWFTTPTVGSDRPHVPELTGSAAANYLRRVDEKAEFALMMSRQALRENARMEQEITKAGERMLAERRKSMLLAVFWGICAGIVIVVAVEIHAHARFRNELRRLHEDGARDQWLLDTMADDGCPLFPEERPAESYEAGCNGQPNRDTRRPDSAGGESA